MSLPSPLLFLLIVVPLQERLNAPSGYTRVPVDEGSFGAWLRTMPVKAGQPKVHLFDGREKQNQQAQWLVLDFDVGDRDLQQCADAVIRLFAEWQWSSSNQERICFRFTSGHEIPWMRWAGGFRPRVKGQEVSLTKIAEPDGSYRNFRKYLESIFSYAGTFSLKRDLGPASGEVQPGDVFIRGGFPGHAVIVVDVVVNPKGERRFALAQSFMPAQDIHVLKNPKGEGPWYSGAERTGVLATPEWTFDWSDRRRFGSSGCP